MLHAMLAGRIGIAAMALLITLPSPLLAQIAQERRGGVAERAYWRYTDANRALASYAAVDRGTCTGTMIGPNIMMTAGHCEASPRATFRLYETKDNRTGETFQTKQFIHTFNNTDLVLHWVFPNSAGENAGDKYGYLDFDLVYDERGRVDYGLSRRRLMPGTEVYSFWQNPVTAIGAGTENLYSAGRITADNIRAWPAPNVPNGDPNYDCHNDGPQRPLVVDSNLWGNDGASGSSTLSAATHRILLGPLSSAARDARGRSQLPIVDYLRYGVADPTLLEPECHPDYLPHVDEEFARELGISNPERYYGKLDKNNDGLFDLHRDLERVRGETPREFYWLGFDSPRRNALWDPANGTRFLPGDAFAHIDTRGAPFSRVLVLEHGRLNLIPGKAYRLVIGGVMQTHGAVPDEPAPIQVILEGWGSQGGNQSIGIDPRESGLWRTVAFEPRDGGYGRLRFTVPRNVQYHIFLLAVLSEDTVFTFDTNDLRRAWTDGHSGTPLIQPNGRFGASRPDWAGVVRASMGPGETEWGLAGDSLGFMPGEQTRLCFDHRRSQRGSFWIGSGIEAVARVRGLRDEIAASRTTFSPIDRWQRRCTDWFEPVEHRAVLQFGATHRGSFAFAAYLIDNVSVERRPVPRS